jgi:hypothetical protein
MTGKRAVVFYDSQPQSGVSFGSKYVVAQIVEVSDLTLLYVLYEIQKRMSDSTDNQLLKSSTEGIMSFSAS